MDEALLPLSKVDLDQLAEALQLEEDVLDEVEDLASEAAQKHLLRQCIVDLLGPSGSLYSSGFKQVKARAKELGLSSEQIKAATVGMADKRAAVLRLILEDALRRAGGRGEGGVPASSTLPDGSTIEIMEKEVLGAGGGGLVTAARMTRRSGATEIVAAKRLPLGSTEKQQTQFVREFEIATKAALECGGVGVCKVYGFVRHQAHMCMIMKKYKESLQDRFDRTTNDDGTHAPMELSEVLTLALQLARALQGLHGAEIRLQDLKPANILFDEAGVPVLSDFGISAIQGATQATSVGGTSNYMCGEMFDETNITPAVDIWSLAAVLVQALSGRVPWLGMKHLAIMKAVLMDQKTPDVPPGLPEAFGVMLQRCFSHVPAQRPVASEIVETLQPLVAALGAEQLLSIHANALLQVREQRRIDYKDQVFPSQT
jgi:serine/threonine protein kinase